MEFIGVCVCVCFIYRVLQEEGVRQELPSCLAQEVCVVCVFGLVWLLSSCESVKMTHDTLISLMVNIILLLTYSGLLVAPELSMVLAVLKVHVSHLIGNFLL